MSQTYFAILTAVGEAKLANAAALGTQLQISRMAVGDGNGNLPVPIRTQTALVNETYRADLNELKVDPLNASQIIAELVIPETEGGYWLREMGLYDFAGDLIAVANCPPSYKPQLAEGSGRTQVMRMVLVVSSTAAVQLKIDPSVVLATRAYADNLIVVHMAAANPHPQYQLRGPVVSLSATTTITEAQLGLVLLDASGGNRTFTLPAASAGLGVREVVLRRTDTSSNALVLAANGTDKLMLDTSVDVAGQATTELLFAGDFLRLRSDGAGKWWCVGQAQLPGSIASGRIIFDTPGSHTLTVPPVLRSGRRIPTLKATGSGAAGGHASDGTTRQRAQGGSAGGTAVKRQSLVGVTSVPISIPAGGVGANNSEGGNGGTTSIGAYISATGGQNNATTVGISGEPGIGVGGDLNIQGGSGFPVTPIFSTSTSQSPLQGHFGGNGGASYYGGGGRGGFAVAGGKPAPGAGGGGNVASVEGVKGQDGGDGIAEIEW